MVIWRSKPAELPSDILDYTLKWISFLENKDTTEQTLPNKSLKSFIFSKHKARKTKTVKLWMSKVKMLKKKMKISKAKSLRFSRTVQRPDVNQQKHTACWQLPWGVNSHTNALPKAKSFVLSQKLSISTFKTNIFLFYFRGFFLKSTTLFSSHFLFVFS